jgi:hypothetical protein
MSLSEPAHFDDSLWPLLIIRLPPQTSPRHHEENLATISAYVRRKERQIHVYDLRRVGMVSAEQRQRQVEWLRENEGLMQDHLLGAALIISSPFVRLAMSVILHLTAPHVHVQVPVVTVASMDAAVAWAVERFEQAGLSASAERIRSHLLAPPRPGEGR